MKLAKPVPKSSSAKLHPSSTSRSANCVAAIHVMHHGGLGDLEDEVGSGSVRMVAELALDQVEHTGISGRRRGQVDADRLTACGDLGRLR